MYYIFNYLDFIWHLYFITQVLKLQVFLQKKIPTHRVGGAGGRN